MELLQDLSVDFSQLVKKHIKGLKKLSSKDQKAFGKLFGDFKDGLDDMSTNESVNEGKYNYKADALTAYFKGKIDAKELDRIARDDFKSGIATKKELSNFLSNKFTQDVMSDTYGIPAGTLIKRVRGLMKFAESVNEAGVPKMYVKYRAVIKKIKELEDKQKELAKPYFDARSKGNMSAAKSQLQLMKKNQKELSGYRRNLASIESKYIDNMDYFPGE